jgi:hypothetical protein
MYGGRSGAPIKVRAILDRSREWRPHRERNNPSPGRLRLVKAPAAGHPLPQERARNQEKTALSLLGEGDSAALGEAITERRQAPQPMTCSIQFEAQ